MRRQSLPLTLAAIALLTAACSPSQAPGWTYAPPTVALPSQPAPSGGGSPATSPAASAAASAGAGGPVVDISAINVTFEQGAATAPAGVPFVIHFDNKDAGITHNVEIRDASGMSMFKGDIVTGPIVVDYEVKPLAAGTYKFVCTVHPNMVGNLAIGG